MPLTWRAIESEYDPDVNIHYERCARLGLACPLAVFQQFFHDERRNDMLVVLLRETDWRTVTWVERELSSVDLRQVSVPRCYRHALDEHHLRVVANGLSDERSEVIEHWTNAGTWLVGPVLVEGSVLVSTLGYELLVGITRLANLLGLLDRGDLAESTCHRVWLGER